MTVLSRVVACCRNLFQKKRVERALSDELAHAFEALVENKMSEGASEAEARRWAAMQLGGVEQVKEQVREVSAGYYIESFLRDVRYAARTLLKNPGFTVMAVATLALGIGANTAVFSAFDALLLQPLPFESSDQLVRLYSTKNGVPIQGFGFPGGLSPLDGRDLRASQPHFSENRHLRCVAQERELQQLSG